MTLATVCEYKVENNLEERILIETKMQMRMAEVEMYPPIYC
jgi:hypothetical protein